MTPIITIIVSRQCEVQDASADSTKPPISERNDPRIHVKEPQPVEDLTRSDECNKLALLALLFESQKGTKNNSMMS